MKSSTTEFSVNQALFFPSDSAECICLSLKSTTATLMLVDNTLGLNGCVVTFKKHAGTVKAWLCIVYCDILV